MVAKLSPRKSTATRTSFRIESRSVIPPVLNSHAKCAPTCKDEAPRAPGVLRLTDRTWQPEALAALVGERKRRLLAPMGSGKSTLIRAIVWHDLKRLDAKGKATTKVIIAVPQLVIAQSFGEVRIELPDGQIVEWAPRHKLIELAVGSTVKKLYDIITKPAQSTTDARIVICTHSTLREVHKLLMEEGRTWDEYGEVSLVIDESHLAKQDVYFMDGEEHVDPNCLGDVIGHWLDHDPGPLMLATATWFRGDLTSIVSTEQLDQFDATYQFTADLYLADLAARGMPLEVVFSYALGTPEDAVRYLHSGRPRYVIDFMRHPNSMSEEGGDKYDRLERRMEALGPYVTKDHLRIHEGPQGPIPSLDLVEDKSEAARKNRQKAFLTSLKTRTNIPRHVCTMQIGQLGLDMDVCDTVLIDGKRNSMPGFLQMGGRALRGLRGKFTAEILTVLEVPNPDEPGYARAVRDHCKTILSSLVFEWQFRAISFPHILNPEIRAMVENVVKNPTGMVKLQHTVVDDRITAPETRPDSEVVAGAVKGFVQTLVDEGQVEPGSPTEVELVNTLVEFVTTEVTRKSREARELHSADEVPDWVIDDANPNILDSLRYYAYSLTHDKLTALRNDMEANCKISYEDLAKEIKRLGITFSTYPQRYTEIERAPKHLYSAGYPAEERKNGYPGLFGTRGPKWMKPKRGGRA